MRHRTAFIAIFALILLQSSAFARNENKLPDIIFPSDDKITESQLVPLKTTELKEVQKSIELTSDFCLDQIKTRIKENLIDEWAWGFKKYDFSGDGTEDLIFTSYCGGEELRNYIWTKKDNKYYYGGVLEGTLSKLYRSHDSKALTIVTRSGWCCVSYVGSINLYSPELNDEILKYRLQKKIKEFYGLAIPDQRMRPRRFTVKNDKYKLRESPVINEKYDEYASGLEGQPVYGNSIAEFKKGSQGVAIAEKPDGTGRVWWFVIMDEDAKTEKNRFNDDQNASKAGWMSSRYLEVID